MLPPERCVKEFLQVLTAVSVFLSLSQKFGEIEELRDQDATSVVMTFKTRSDAENVCPADGMHTVTF